MGPGSVTRRQRARPGATTVVAVGATRAGRHLLRRCGRYVPDRAAAGRADGSRLDRAHWARTRWSRCCGTVASPLSSPTASTRRSMPHAQEHCCCSPRPSASPMNRSCNDWPTAPADLLLVEPTSHARAALAPGIRSGGASVLDAEPDCALREANQAGSVDFGPSNTFHAVGDRTLSSCYGGVLVRYRCRRTHGDGGRQHRFHDQRRSLAGR